jgi:lipoate-protein ligase A
MKQDSRFLEIFTEHDRWRIIDEPLSLDPQQALKHDTALLQEIAKGKRGATARLWETPQCLVVTKKETRFPNYEEAVIEMSKRKWLPIVRSSGGTAVPLHPGILNLSIIVPQTTTSNFDLDDMYMALCEPISRALEKLGLEPKFGETPGSYCDGRYNLNIDGLKVTGTAQKTMLSPPNSKQLKQGVLAQAMLMVEADAKQGTEVVNLFYDRAGNKRQFDPSVATSVQELIKSEGSKGELTLTLRKMIIEELNALIKE